MDDFLMIDAADFEYLRKATQPLGMRQAEIPARMELYQTLRLKIEITPIRQGVDRHIREPEGSISLG